LQHNNHKAHIWKACLLNECEDVWWERICQQHNSHRIHIDMVCLLNACEDAGESGFLRSTIITEFTFERLVAWMNAKMNGEMRFSTFVLYSLEWAVWRCCCCLCCDCSADRCCCVPWCCPHSRSLLLLHRPVHEEALHSALLHPFPPFLPFLFVFSLLCVTLGIVRWIKEKWNEVKTQWKRKEEENKNCNWWKLWVFEKKLRKKRKENSFPFKRKQRGSNFNFNISPKLIVSRLTPKNAVCENFITCKRSLWRKHSKKILGKRAWNSFNREEILIPTENRKRSQRMNK